MNQNKNQTLANRKMGAGMVIGMGFGALCGLLAHNIPLGVALGVPIGIGLATALQQDNGPAEEAEQVPQKEYSHDQ